MGVDGGVFHRGDAEIPEFGDAGVRAEPGFAADGAWSAASVGGLVWREHLLPWPGIGFGSMDLRVLMVAGLVTTMLVALGPVISAARWAENQAAQRSIGGRGRFSPGGMVVIVVLFILALIGCAAAGAGVERNGGGGDAGLIIAVGFCGRDFLDCGGKFRGDGLLGDAADTAVWDEGVGAGAGDSGDARPVAAAAVSGGDTGVAGAGSGLAIRGRGGGDQPGRDAGAGLGHARGVDDGGFWCCGAGGSRGDCQRGRNCGAAAAGGARGRVPGGAGDDDAAGSGAAAGRGDRERREIRLKARRRG